MIEEESLADVYLIRESKLYYKRLEIYAKNIYSQMTKRLYQPEYEVSPYDIPEEITELLHKQEN
ncbi:MAG: hypothetical protein F6K23_03755 [Okeania sp. SIO2C9]|uniref:hypothetical protein n=2 Tax=Okeania sp. SIO2C9 TaxID=2607791 RepID=UPI0013BFFEC8|nr:hypothetical protein [Okeania sp. SIO2C9]NEQ72268.1 hypothetical protein [Okeania sp. SIO2C9]